MQYLKEDLRNRIVEVALNEFYEKGYENSNIKIIASKADTSPGNIYHYYGSKQELLMDIYVPIEKKIAGRFFVEGAGDQGDLDTKTLVEMIVSLIEEHPKEFYLLASTTLADSFKNRLVDQVMVKLMEEEDEEMAFIKASLIVEGMMIIVRRHVSSMKNTKKNIKRLIDMLLERGN